MGKQADYDGFAIVYNQYWGGFSLQIMPILEQLALNDYPAGNAILDLCCGTGQLASELTERGYTVAGVDGSEQMLSYARTNAPKATFHFSDVRCFELPSDFAIAFSTYDSLNHLLSLDDLQMVFVNVYRQLKTDGVFVFDMNLESGFQSRWVGPFNIWSENTAVISESEYNESEKLATANITIFSQNEDDKSLWRRTDVTLTQRAYTVDEIVKTLARASFADIEVFDALRDFKLRQVGRAFFRAKKLSSQQA